MPENPFIASVRALLLESDWPLSEHELIKRLQERCPDFAFSGTASQLALFRKHFLVMNALYTLQSELLAEGRYLSISPLAIRLEPAGDVHLTGLPADAADARLREYYLDWSNLRQTQSEDVDALLAWFWERYVAADRRREALRTLGLAEQASLEAVRQAYRRLAARHHPDKGGDAARFRAVREAYLVLLRCYA